MGMPVIIEILPSKGRKKVIESHFGKVFDYFKYIDEKFSPYKQNSEVTKINDGRLKEENVGGDMKLVFALSEATKKDTDGYFDIKKNNFLDPSGIVKGWAIYNASKLVSQLGYENFYISAGGDIQTKGVSINGKKWAVGIRNPFNVNENVKVIYLTSHGIATSGIYERGNHIYNPKGKMSDEVVSLSVIGANVYEADRFATAAFAIGRAGINFIEKQNGLEGYMIDSKGIATMTSGFHTFTND